MTVVYFIGDKPSSKNVDPNIPFVGTQSYKRLLEWIWKMDIDITDVSLLNSTNLESLVYHKFLYSRERVPYPEEKNKIVALGENASKILTSIDLKHYKLPHPSGRNYKLNDKAFVQKSLKECKEYLNV